MERSSQAVTRGTAPVQESQYFNALHELKLCTSLLIREMREREDLGLHWDFGTVGWMVVPSSNGLSRSKSESRKKDNEFNFHLCML